MNSGPIERIRDLRIALLIDSDGPGGAEKVIADLAGEFRRAGCYALAVLPADGEGWLTEQLSGMGVAIEYYQLDRPLSWRFPLWLRRTSRRHAISVVHSHDFTLAVYGAWALIGSGIPHIVTMHGGRYYAQRLRRRLALRSAFAASRAVVAVSRVLGRDLSRTLRISESRITVIPNGVRFRPAEKSGLREELCLGAGDRLLVSVGNLYPVKGHRFLVEALALLGERHSRVHVAIGGRGECGEALQTQAERLGVADRLHLLGLRSDVPNLMAAADVFVLPSLSEGLPIALLEAMFAGCPIVASDVGDIREALADGEAGVLVEPTRPDALAAALEKLLDEPSVAAALGSRAARLAATRYDVRKMAGRYAEVYWNACAGAREKL
jgi:glycosyltransferase involved in cell wall biosynthesis